jgi:anti-sigma factor RsiW
MTHKDLSEEWAWSQLEAWADESLTGENRARMAVALAANPRLKAAADRAVAVRRALRASSALQPAMPAGLRLQLLAIPGRSAWPTFALPAAAAVVIAIVAIAVTLRPAAPPPLDAQQVAAIQELETALRYLQKSAVITENEVTTALGSGLRDAVDASRAAVRQQTDETGG